ENEEAHEARQPPSTSSYLSWLVGEEKDPELVALEAKADRYVTQLLALDRVLQQWRHKKLDNQEAVLHADNVMENICSIGEVDGDLCRQHLKKQGISDERRTHARMAFFARSGEQLWGQGPQLARW
ncbi:Hypothetical protein SCF082_LOCUS6644, partial [Durusdinium trenchii]